MLSPLNNIVQKCIECALENKNLKPSIFKALWLGLPLSFVTREEKGTSTIGIIKDALIGTTSKDLKIFRKIGKIILEADDRFDTTDDSIILTYGESGFGIEKSAFSSHSGIFTEQNWKDIDKLHESGIFSKDSIYSIVNIGTSKMREEAKLSAEFKETRSVTARNGLETCHLDTD
ncbi:MAG TPA: hypothetical protein DIV86_00390, partial [Alphaproteobacteria bacterium]|nr:hypothetical protein [Alphaproteobacteria bacterium]